MAHIFAEAIQVRFAPRFDCRYLVVGRRVHLGAIGVFFHLARGRQRLKLETD
jgi:hypothetical protein